MHTVLAVVDGKEVKLDVEEGAILYDACEAQGVQLPHGCLSGACGACRIEVLENPQGLRAPSTVEQDTVNSVVKRFEDLRGKDSMVGKTIRLSCRAKVCGPLKFTPYK